MHEMQYDFRSARRAFSRVGLALSAMFVIATAMQFLLLAGAELIWGEENWLNSTSWGMWLLSAVPMYAVATPLSLLILRTLPALKPEDHKLSAGFFAVIIPICFFITYVGNMIGTFLSLLLSGGTAENAIAEIVMDNNPLKILVVVILAPLVEEYICRKQVIDRTRQYGENIAILFSALAFGLLHQNLFQFFYAFGVGLVFGYVYIRSGRLRYTVILHMLINFLGSVVAPWILSLMDLDTLLALESGVSDAEMMQLVMSLLPGYLLYMLYAFLQFGLAAAGLVLLIAKWKKRVWKWAPAQLPMGTAARTAYWNGGMVLYIVLCLAMMVLALM